MHRLDYLAGRTPRWAGPVARYVAAGDMLEVYFEDVPAYAEPVDPGLTLLRADSDDRVVGVKVLGVRAAIGQSDPPDGDAAFHLGLTAGLAVGAIPPLLGLWIMLGG